MAQAACIQPLQRRAQPGHQHHLALRLAPKQPGVTRLAGHAGIGRWPGHGPAKLREQPDGGLLNKLVFGVGVGPSGSTANYFSA